MASLPPSTLDSDSVNSAVKTGEDGTTDLQKLPTRSRDPWHMAAEVRALRQRAEQAGEKPRRLGVTWQNLTVKGLDSSATFSENVLSSLWPFQKQYKAPMKTILDSSFGCVKPGEMLLVLGRPGAGCTTLLNVLSNNRLGYEEISGDVHFGTMDSAEAETYRSQIILNGEEEVFFPMLTVEDTLRFAARNKVPRHLPPGVASAEQYVRDNEDFLLRLAGIPHTAKTKVGDAFHRGVSGGERKRVSILECLATRGSLFCWDNSTRGLDANTALEWIKAMRVLTDVLGLTTIITLYQAGNGIYDNFDKVLVLDEGKQVYYGPQREAVPFMHNLGFLKQPGANSADFLTGVTVPTERIIAPGHEDSYPRTAADLLAAYASSPVMPEMLRECRDYVSSPEARENTALLKEAVAEEKHAGVGASSPVTASLPVQISAAVSRQFAIMWGDRSTMIMLQAATLFQAVIGGSLFYDAPDNSAGLLLKGGALFFAVLYNTLIALSEVTDSFTGRPILAKHRSFALYRPVAVVLSKIVADIPTMTFQVTQFGIVFYFMVGLKMTAGAFFTYWITNLVTALAMTMMFRSIGAAFPNFDAANKVSSLATGTFFVYMGYMISKDQMHPWLGWIWWINPMAYAFETLLTNEFNGVELACVGQFLIPNGPGYGPGLGGQACAGVLGARPGASVVTGDDYLGALDFSYGHAWRNFGVVCAWYVFYTVLTIFFTSRWKLVGEGGRSLLIPRERQAQAAHLLKPADAESQSVAGLESSSAGRPSGSGAANVDENLIRNKTIFTWRNLTYVVKTREGDRVLLDDVQGYVKPGMLGALMGSSGAGKTTLLDVLAQRKTEGTITGSVLVDGRPLPLSFQRSAGYVEQLDIHEPLATVREALEFSALLRQSRDTPDEEKLRYVDTIVDLLELHDIEHTLVGRPGAGLSVEQRKRLTIGVELVAKPSILIFLDEPTSGLDGQAAFNTIRFLRKLADVGQAVLVTIHQPSAQLFAQFDTLLLLTTGGRTVYFGDIGEDASAVRDYFARNGEPCPPDVNPAEHMIDVVTGHGHAETRLDWTEIWKQSSEYEKLCLELDDMTATAAARESPLNDDGHEFAAPIWTQVKLVTHRMNVSLYRNVEYISNKIVGHISLALLNGFTFWMIGDSLSDVQQNLFTIFNFILVAPGVIAQLQPLFIDRRDIYEAREKKSKMYHWAPFVTGLIVSEFPYLIACAFFYFVCWYFTAGLPSGAWSAGSLFVVIILYECLYTGVGQAIAAYTPNAVFASLVNPIIIVTLVSFCGVMVPYSQMQEFWRYWMYYIDPYNYMMGAFLVFTTWDKSVRCREGELSLFDPPANQTCGEYLGPFRSGGVGAGSNLLNPDALSGCRVCQYTSGSDFLRTLELKEASYGWRNTGIVFGFCVGCYALVFLMLKLRTKATKKAESKK
ncbi:Protein SNQ2 [Colletotrichum sidae]|uniref:Protein SNQ2 n=1 Tax=Colletotrichum sidae TaxID=1347389 RepID=A0A4R8T2S3_9PEZI|nr:Protein SNQ2 [Colletotrichum sidae]